MPALDPQSLPRHLNRLYRAAWALCGSPHDAEDLVQETFARVLARPRLLRGQDELAYLMTVLRNTFLTQRRTASRRPRTGSPALDELEPVDPRTSDRPEEALQAREVFAVIAKLPERYRLALVAVDVAGLSYREAANVLETKEATIATRVFRARQLVARTLERGGDADAGEPPALKDRSVLSEDSAVGEAPVPPDKPASKTHSTPGKNPSLHKKDPSLQETPAPSDEPAPKTHSTPGTDCSLEETPALREMAALDEAPTPNDGLRPEESQVSREGGRPGRRLIQRGNR